MKKLLAVILSCILLTTAALPALTVFAASPAGVETATDTYETIDSSYKKNQNSLDKFIRFLINAICTFIPGGTNFISASKYDNTGFMQGMSTDAFTTGANDDSAWHLGYDKRSLITSADDIIGKCYVGGTITVKKKYATAIEDDLAVRTIALSDGQNGIAVFMALDAYGLSNPDVRTIRTALADYCKQNNVVSINISVLHQHSAVDTLGMNGDVATAVFANPWRNIFRLKAISGKNDAYMANLYAQCEASAKAAVSSMTTGRLYYSTADATAYLHDKRQPYVNDPNFNRFRFVPTDSSVAETWLVSTSIHCVGNGAAGTLITADYPYYAEQVINAAGANVMFMMGAQQSNTSNDTAQTVVNYSDSMDRVSQLKGFGQSIGNELVAIDDSTEKEITPHLAIRYAEVKFTMDNPILLFAGKEGLFGNTVLRENCKNYVMSEIGYMELGDNFAFAFIPGELAPELAFGGCLGAKYSSAGTDWTYPSLQDIVNKYDSDRTLLPFGLSNDQIGYIIPDNNYMALLADQSQSTELVSLGSSTASTLITAFEGLIGECNPVLMPN